MNFINILKIVDSSKIRCYRIDMKNTHPELNLPKALAEAAAELLAEGKNRLAKKILHAHIDTIPDETADGASIAAEGHATTYSKKKPRRSAPAADHRTRETRNP